MSVIQNYLMDEATPATVLAVICTDILGEDFLSYEVETVVDSLEKATGAVIPEDNVDKIQAIQTIYTTNSFFMDIPAFLAVVDAFNGNGVDFDYADMPHLNEIAWAVTEVLMNDPEQDMDNLFAPDVEVFIKKVLEEEGFSRIPPSLDFLKDVKVYSTENTILDDPIIYESHHNIQKGRVDEVEDYVAANIMRVIGALKEIPLQNRDENSWNKLIKSIG